MNLQRFSAFAVSEDGATATEYAVMLALIILVCIGAITSFGLVVQGQWATNEDSITNAMKGS